ncbi:MAG: hypothetical protein KDC46_15730 [Thermoleophilia bacterium]|nr:hypothetical protein [Thermoleophilia bacterium]
MRRILPIAIGTAVLVSAFAGVASARLSTDEPAGPAPAPLAAPAALPTEDSVHPGAFGYHTSDELAARYETGDATGDAGGTTSGGASATVTVTATVLPVVFLVYDDSGALVRIATNTPERDAQAVLFLPRTGSESGSPATLDADAWAAARAALADAHEGTGTIWTA